MALETPTGILLRIGAAPNVVTAGTVMSWFRTKAGAGFRDLFELHSAVKWDDAIWVGMNEDTLEPYLEVWSDPNDNVDIAAAALTDEAWWHLLLEIDGNTYRLFASNEDHSVDMVEVCSITTTDLDRSLLAQIFLTINPDWATCGFKVFEGQLLSTAEKRWQRDHWQVGALDAWCNIPNDRPAVTFPQTYFRDVTLNQRHLENPTLQGSLECDPPAILQYASAGSVRVVEGAAATAAAAVTTIDVAVPTGAYSSGNDVVRVNDAMILSLVHGGAGWATVPAEWTLVERGLSGVMRLEVYRKNYGMLDGVPTAEVTPVAITGIDGGIGRIVVYSGMEHADALEIASSVKTGSGVRPNCDPLETGADWGPACLDVMVVGLDSNTSISTDTWRATQGGIADALGGVDVQADVDLDPNTAGEAFKSVFAGFQLWHFDSVKISKGEAGGWRMDSTLAVDPWAVVRVVLKPHDVPFFRRGYYSTGRVGLSLTRTTDFPSAHVDDYYYSPGADNAWVVFNKLEPRKDRTTGAGDDSWTSNEEVAVAWHEYAHPIFGAMSFPEYTLLKVNYYAEIDENYVDFGTTAVTVRFKGRVYLTTSLTDLSEATVLIDNWVSGSMFARGTRQYITEPFALPPFSTSGPCWLVLVWGMVFEDIPLPAVNYPDADEWVTVKNLINAGNLGGNMNVGRNDGPESGNKDGYAPWVEWSEHFLRPALPAAPANQTRAGRIVIDPASVPGYASGDIDTRGATSPMQSLWWELTPDTDIEAIFHTFGSQGQVNIRVWNATATDLIDAVQVDDDHVGVNGCVSWWRGLLTGGVTYLIQLRRPREVSPYSYGGTVQLTAETVRTLQADDIFIPQGNGNTVMVWREGHLINVSAFNAQGWIAGGVAIDYTRRPMLDFRDVQQPGSVDPVHTDYRLVIGMHDTAIAPGNPYAIILDLATLNPNQAVIDYIFWGRNGIDPFGLGAIEVDAAGNLYVGSEGWFSKIAGGVTAFEKGLSQLPQDAAILKFDLVKAWYQAGFDTTPTGYPIIMPADYEKTGTNFIRLTTDLARLLYTSSGFYVTPEGGNGTKVKAITVTGTQEPDEVSPITPGVGPNAGPKGICPLDDGGFLLCNGSVVQRYNAAGALTQTYTPTGPVPFSLSDVDLNNAKTHFYCFDMGLSWFYKFNLATGEQVTEWPTYGYPGTGHSFVLFRPDRFGAAARTEVIRRKWLRRATHLSNEDRRLFHHAFELDLEVGVGNDDAPDPDVMLRWSDDGGHTWSHEHWRKVGVAGEFGKRVRWQRLGAARDRVYEVSGSDPVKIALINAYLQTREGLH